MSRNPETATKRRLTISTLYEPQSRRTAHLPQPDRVVPFLRLRGRWLEDLGFACGEKVRVVAERGRLVIEPLGGEKG